MSEQHIFQKKLTPTFALDEVVRLPAPGMAYPTSISFSKDDQWLAYLYSAEGSLNQQLCFYDVKNGNTIVLSEPDEGGVREENLSPEEALQRERQRQRALGITGYSWAEESNRVLVPLRGDLYLIECPGEPLQKIFSCKGRPAIDARFSPDGAWVSFVRDGEIHLLSLEDGKTRQLTSGAASSGKTHGLAEYIAQEEMGRSEGYWWSPDSRWIAFTEVDETHIPIYRISHLGKDTTGEGSYEDHRYPFAGCSNARVRLGLISVDGGQTSWLDLEAADDCYLARVNWYPGNGLAVQMINRRQNELTLFQVELSGSGKTVLLRETSDIWINLHDMFKPLKSRQQFIWGSERSGFRHLYLYDFQGNLVRTLTEGEWVVDAVLRVDEKNGRVYFSGWRDDPCEKHLFCVSLDGGEIRQLTQEKGMHNVIFDHNASCYVDTFHSLDAPPHIVLRSFEKGDEISKSQTVERILFENQDERLKKLNLLPPKIIKVKIHTGDILYGALYLPPEKYGEGPFPTLVNVYGGPHDQRVTRGWNMTANMQAQYLAGLGFLVFMLDNRGSWRRGLQFEGAIRHRMGHVEIEDQVAGVQYLVERGLADAKRVGIWGWSYGGYMSAMCLARAPQVFKAAVAGAPVTDWDGYDTHYTEHYMGLPQENPDGYVSSSIFPYAGDIKGHLLLIHGLIDENVHFRHTARLINALIAAGKRYDLLIFPDARHMPRKPADLRYLQERIRDFFLENLTE